MREEDNCPAIENLQKHPGYVAAKCSQNGEAEVFCLQTGERTEVAPPVADWYLRREPVFQTDGYVSLQNGFDSSHFYTVPEVSSCVVSGTLASDEIGGLKARKGKGVKVVPVSGDVTLLHNTSALHEIASAECQMKDNPMMALGRLYAQAYNFLVQDESYKDVYVRLKGEYGNFVEEDDYMAFICDLETMGFLERCLLSRLSEDSLACLKSRERVWDLNIARIQNLLTYTELPLYTLLELTYECNLACEICYTNHLSQKVNVLSDERFLTEVLQPVIDSGVSYVTILGGEPLLKPELLYEVVRRLRKNDVYVKVITNGTLIGKEEASMLAEVGVNKIEVSFDGFSLEKDNAIRIVKEGCPKVNVHLVAKEAIAHLKQAGIPQVGVSVTVNAQNYDEVMNDMVSFVRETSVNKIYFSVYYSDKPEESGLEITPDQKKHLLEKCNEWTNFLSSEIYDFEAVVLGSDTAWRCSCGRSSVVVNPFGVLRTCPFTSNMDDRLDYTNPDSFKDIWSNSDLFWTIRGLPRHECSTRLFRDTGSYQRS